MNIVRPFLSIVLFSLAVNSYANIVQVVKLRGNATYLSNGMLAAKPIELNQWYPKDTSILTAEKSFLILRYKTGSEMTLGPNSKVVIDTGMNKEQQVVNLLVGKFKASVKNIQKNNDNKMIIKTSYAALGIRGTEFQTSYNPQTKITSLLTFHGAVAMAKIEPGKNEESQLKDNSVLVKLGEYSGVSGGTNTVTAPVKISPDQFTKLKLNQTLGATTEKIDEKVYKKELEQIEKSYASTKTDKKDNSAKEAIDVRPGGYLDSETGLYLAPSKNSEFDEKLNVYKSSDKIGKVDDAGNYIPPVGLKLDPTKGGFIVDEKVASNDSVALANELNKEVSTQIEKPVSAPVKKKNTLENNNEDVYKKYYDPTTI